MNIKHLWHSNKIFIIFILSMMVFRSAIADYYHIPSGSMEPTLEVGDRIAVDKMAYDLRIPFTHISISPTAEPQRGDIIVFDSKQADNRLIKRIVGLPGDNVAMVNETLYINNIKQVQSLIESDNQRSLALEQLGKHRHLVAHNHQGSKSLANFSSVTVPADHFLVLGDNRRNSADSRVYGFVPRNEILGRAHTVLFSLNSDKYYLPKNHRFITPIS